MTRDELLEILRAFHGPRGDPEDEHRAADLALLKYIADLEITTAFLSIKRYYS